MTTLHFPRRGEGITFSPTCASAAHLRNWCLQWTLRRMNWRRDLKKQQTRCISLLITINNLSDHSNEIFTSPLKSSNSPIPHQLPLTHTEKQDVTAASHFSPHLRCSSTCPWHTGPRALALIFGYLDLICNHLEIEEKVAINPGADRIVDRGF